MTTALQAELDRAHALHGDGHHLRDGTGPNTWPGWRDQNAEYELLAARLDYEAAELEGELTWALVLREEVSEALAESDPDLLTAELLQVATVALRWVDAIAARGRR